MSLRAGAWKTVTIAASGTTSSEIDLGKEFEFVQVYNPAIDSATITVKPSRVNTDTAVQAYAFDDDATGDFVHTTTARTAAGMNIFRVMAQFVTVVLGAAQTGGARTIYIRGIDPL
jgi:hypothetical protein